MTILWEERFLFPMKQNYYSEGEGILVKHSIVFFTKKKYNRDNSYMFVTRNNYLLKVGYNLTFYVSINN